MAVYPKMDETQLRINGHIYEIGEVNDEIIGHRQGFAMAAEVGYRETFEHVAECATTDEIDAVAEYIKDYIRDYEDRPTNRKVRRKARSICTENGYKVDDYLARA